MNFLEEIKNNKKPTDILKDLGVLLRKERKKQKISQKELADFVNVSIDSISKIERGTENYNILTLLKVMKYFNLLSLFVEFIEKENKNYEMNLLTKIMNE